jgi:A/G-specific adenine glycosylase
MSPTFVQIVAKLERRFGRTPAPNADPFAFVLLEQVAYLATDKKRLAAFDALEQRVGLAPERVLAAPAAVLTEVCAIGGMNAKERAERLKRSAALVLEHCDGDLNRLARMPLPAARKLARAFDSFGTANAETLLLVAGVPVPALDSNGVRVLARVWFGGEEQRYAADHRRACDGIVADGPIARDMLMRGYLALRRHGRTVCRRSDPDCPGCPVRATCAYAQRRHPRAGKP